MLTLQLILFFVGSAVIVYVSRASLRDPRSHGFYRCFAWEFILALFLLNAECWFCDLFAGYQIISWVLLILSIIPVVLGVQQLRTTGKPDENRNETPMLAFEKTTTLVTVGVYKYIRHPLYSSLLILTWGIFFKAPWGWSWLLAIASTLCLIATAKFEEQEDIRYFGAAYRDYMQHSQMFIPFVL